MNGCVPPSRPSLEQRKVRARQWGWEACARIRVPERWLLRLGVRYPTGGSDVGYILSAGRADVKQLREPSRRVCRTTWRHRSQAAADRRKSRESIRLTHPLQDSRIGA